MAHPPPWKARFLTNQLQMDKPGIRNTLLHVQFHSAFMSNITLKIVRRNNWNKQRLIHTKNGCHPLLSSLMQHALGSKPPTAEQWYMRLAIRLISNESHPSDNNTTIQPAATRTYLASVYSDQLLMSKKRKTQKGVTG
jgi:hypothetical protein